VLCQPCDTQGEEDKGEESEPEPPAACDAIEDGEDNMGVEEICSSTDGEEEECVQTQELVREGEEEERGQDDEEEDEAMEEGGLDDRGQEEGQEETTCDSGHSASQAGLLDTQNLAEQ
jgi:hypothetical protein